MRGWISPKALLAGGCVLLSACATNMEYVPTEQVSAQIQGRPASQYRVPPESPRGDVTVVSRGVVHVESDGHRADMLHVAVRLSNDQDSGPWTFDVREQKLLVPGAGPITPAPVSPAAGGAPVVNVAPGAQRTMDLYFPTPPGVKTNRLHAFDLLWTVRTPQTDRHRAYAVRRMGIRRLRVSAFPSVSVGSWLRPALVVRAALLPALLSVPVSVLVSPHRLPLRVPPSPLRLPAVPPGRPRAAPGGRAAGAPPCRARGRHRPCRAFRCRRLRQRPRPPPPPPAVPSQPNISAPAPR